MREKNDPKCSICVTVKVYRLQYMSLWVSPFICEVTSAKVNAFMCNIHEKSADNAHISDSSIIIHCMSTKPRTKTGHDCKNRGVARKRSAMWDVILQSPVMSETRTARRPHSTQRISLNNSCEHCYTAIKAYKKQRIRKAHLDMVTSQ